MPGMVAPGQARAGAEGRPQCSIPALRELRPMMAPPALLHSAFYRFTPLADPVALAGALRARAQAVHGSIMVASEGINGAVAGEGRAIAAFEAALQQDDLQGGAFRGMRFQRSACVTEPFGRLKISVKPEIVALGLPQEPGHSVGGHLPRPDEHGASHLARPDEHDASHLAPLAWRSLLARDDLVLLDNRNHFEYRLGHFRGAVDPEIDNFRDFVAHVQAHAPAWRAAGRPVAMYCTGGVRCDKSAPWLRSLGLEVWQLDGGILNYFHHLHDAGRDWLGECFVFDRRLALNCRLEETATTAEQVFDAARADEAWRLQRARHLGQA